MSALTFKINKNSTLFLFKNFPIKNLVLFTSTFSKEKQLSSAGASWDHYQDDVAVAAGKYEFEKCSSI